MRAVRLIAIAALITVLQLAFVSKLRLLGVHPDALLALGIAVSLTGGRNRGAVAGFVTGLVADSFLTSPLGLSALAYTVACYAAGHFGEDTSGAPWVNAFIGLLASLGAFALFMIVGTVTGDLHTSVHHAIAVLLAEGLIGMIATPIAVWVTGNAWQARVDGW